MSAVNAFVQQSGNVNDPARLLPRHRGKLTLVGNEGPAAIQTRAQTADPLDEVDPDILELMDASEPELEFEAASLPQGFKLEPPVLVEPSAYGVLQHRIEVSAIAARAQALEPDLDLIRSY